MRALHALLVQFDSGDDKARNLDRMAATLDKLPQAELIVLPELWPTGAFRAGRFADHAEAQGGPLVRFLSDRARLRRCWLHGGSIVERCRGRLHNTSLLFSPRGELRAAYRKRRLFSYQCRESEILSPGRRYALADTPWGRLGLATCYELRFPEHYRALLDRGAEGFLTVSAWPSARREAWELFVRCRAAENQAWHLAANARGDQDGLALAGHSLAVGAEGDVLARADARAPWIEVEIDLDAARRHRRDFPILRDR